MTGSMTLDYVFGRTSTISHAEDAEPNNYLVVLAPSLSALTVEFFVRDIDIAKQSPYLIVKLFKTERVDNLQTKESSYRRRFFFRYTTGAVSEDIAMYSVDGGKTWRAITTTLLIPFQSVVRINADPYMLLNIDGAVKYQDGTRLNAERDRDYAQIVTSDDKRTTFAYHTMGAYRDKANLPVMSIDMLVVHSRI